MTLTENITDAQLREWAVVPIGSLPPLNLIRQRTELANALLVSREAEETARRERETFEEQAGVPLAEAIGEIAAIAALFPTDSLEGEDSLAELVRMRFTRLERVEAEVARLTQRCESIQRENEAERKHRFGEIHKLAADYTTLLRQRDLLKRRLELVTQARQAETDRAGRLERELAGLQQRIKELEAERER